MLLSFKTENYKSFRDGFDFSLQPAPKQKGLDYSVLEEKVGRKKVRALCCTVIYGPNASGKTNIVGAMDTFKEIVLRGHIRNGDISQIGSKSNAAAMHLGLIPNSTLSEPKPVSFELRFVEKGLLFHYKLTLDLGLFLQDPKERRILEEELLIDDEPIFKRADGIQFFEVPKKLKPYFVEDKQKDKRKLQMDLAVSGLNSLELFLANGFKAIFSPSLFEMMTNWLRDKFIVVYHAEKFGIGAVEDGPHLSTLGSMINPAAQAFGINSNQLAFVYQNNDSGRAILCSDVAGKVVPAEMYESYGTIRFISLFPLLVMALDTGATLVIDAFDASIHPSALMSIVNVFHNDEINVNHAQLIFNTHNPIFLNSDICRRDEIKFVERQDETCVSQHYSLSDFGTAGSNGVRKGEDYLKNYLVGRYGAIKDIDFSKILASRLEENKTSAEEK